MSAVDTKGATRKWFGAAITAVAMVVSLAVVVALLQANMFFTRELQASRFRASIVPASGNMSGLKAVDGSEWSIKDDEQHLVVLFGVADTGTTGDMEYWRDVASRSQLLDPSIQFVGFCGTCGQPPAGQITLLKFMDPLQTHALMTGARQRRAFVFNGVKARGMVLVLADRAAFAAQIAELSRPTTTEGGA